MNLINKTSRFFTFIFTLALISMTFQPGYAGLVNSKKAKSLLSRIKVYDQAALEKMGVKYNSPTSIKTQSAGTYFQLTVINGSRSGSFESGTPVLLIANPPPAGMAIGSWYINGVEGTPEGSIIVRMPPRNLTVEMRFRPIEPTDHVLTINGGIGSSVYGEGSIYYGFFNTPPNNQFLSSITGVGGEAFTSFFGDLMPNHDVTFSPVYSPVTNQVYLNVVNGQGSRYMTTSDLSLIMANTIDGKDFDHWESDTCEITLFRSPIADVSANQNCTITAIYRDAPNTTKYNLTVVNGTGSGQYTEGTHVNISANAAPEGFKFDRWAEPIGDPTAPNTSIIMPAHDMTVTATYAWRNRHVLNFSQSVFTYAESATSAESIAQVNYSSGTYGLAVIKWKITGGTAQPGVDFTGPTEGLESWIDGDTHAFQLHIPFINNTTYKGDRTINLQIGMDSGNGEVGPQSTAVIVIKEDDNPSVSVTNGSGSGQYLIGGNVTITANPPSDGFVFDHWDGYDLGTSSRSLTAVFPMPSQNISLQAVYKATPFRFFSFSNSTYTYVESQPETETIAKINVVSGDTGDVTIKWKIIGGSARLGSDYISELTGTDTWHSGEVFSSIIKFKLVDDAIFKGNRTIKLSFDVIEGTATIGNIKNCLIVITDNDKPRLTVFDGSGSGNYNVGETVTIKAYRAPSGMFFDRWTGVVVESETSPTTNLIMPYAHSTVRANYKYPITGIFSFSTGTYLVSEFDKKLQITITRKSTDSACGIYLRNIDGTAKQYQDYLPVAQPSATPSPSGSPYPNASPSEYNEDRDIPMQFVFFKKGQDTKNVDVTIINDKKAESSESFILKLSTFEANGAALGIISRATIVISDDDQPKLTVLNGTGSGSYVPGDLISIKAEKSAGFLRWEGAVVQNPLSPVTLFTMPETEVTIQAIYQQQEDVLQQNTVTSTGFVKFINKFSPSHGEKANIKFSLVNSGHVTLKVYDTLGKEVVSLDDSDHPGGSFSTIAWDGRNGSGERLSADIYILVMKINDVTYRQKIALVN